MRLTLTRTVRGDGFGTEWDLGAEMRVRVCGKLDVLDRILPKLKEAGHRVLIYSQMVQVCLCLCLCLHVSICVPALRHLW